MKLDNISPKKWSNNQSKG